MSAPKSGADQIQRRTLSTLMIGQALGTAAAASMLAALGLLAAELLGSDSLAGLPAAVGTLGTALIASPLAGLAVRKGRRPALWAGYGLGALGAAIASLAGEMGVFWILLVGMTIFGGGQAAGLQSRFAAADLATPERRARDISRVVWVATIGGVLGPVLNSTRGHGRAVARARPLGGTDGRGIPSVPDRRRVGCDPTPARSALASGGKGGAAAGGAAQAPTDRGLAGRAGRTDGVARRRLSGRDPCGDGGGHDHDAALTCVTTVKPGCRAW